MNGLQHFFQAMGAWKVWHALFHDFIWMDWALVLTVGAALFFGISRGFGFFFGKLIRALILIFSVMLLGPPFSKWSAAHLTFAKIGFWTPFFFVILSAFFCWALRKISKMQSKQSLPQFHPFWDSVVGATAGFFMVVLVASFIAQFFLMLPSKKIESLFEKGGSRYGKTLNDFTPQLVEDTLTPIRMLVNQRVSHS